MNESKEQSCRYVMKISHKKQLLDVRHYVVFQNALADIAEKKIFDNISNELFNTLDNPNIYCASFSDERNAADDFEFRYSNGVQVYIGEIFPVDGINNKQED